LELSKQGDRFRVESYAVESFTLQMLWCEKKHHGCGSVVSDQARRVSTIALVVGVSKVASCLSGSRRVDHQGASSVGFGVMAVYQ